MDEKALELVRNHINEYLDAYKKFENQCIAAIKPFQITKVNGENKE